VAHAARLLHLRRTTLVEKLRKLGMFSQSNATLLLTNPKALESLAQYFDEEVAQRPLI
jgi:hypothetical protein